MEPSISPVARSEADYNGRVNLEGPQPAVDKSGGRALRGVRSPRSEASEETAATDSAAQAEEAQRKAKAEVAPNPLSDLAIKFKVDPDTKEVTLLILDKQSHKVVRTIPAEEMEKLKPGDLLELFA